MITFLFWNLNRKPLHDLIAKLAIDHDVDIIILAECRTPMADLLEALNANTSEKYGYAFSPSDRLQIFTRFPDGSITPLFDDGLITIRRVSPPIGVEILLVAAHLSSKLYQEGVDQALMATRIARYIDDAEAYVSHTRTVVVGDLNMNPFEVGVVGAEALHAVMDREVARKGSRIVQGQPRQFFYNPMWGLLGDGPPGPPGTYYRGGAQQVNYFWNTFDQVLIRPSLIENFSNDHIEVLTSVGADSLLNERGTPDAIHRSDHLPVLFRLDVS